MTDLRQGWLVARREIRERSRSGAFRAGLVVMLAIVVAMVVVPSLVDPAGATRDVGLTGTAPAALTQAIEDQGDAVGTTVRVHRYDDTAAGRAAVRQDEVDLLVVDARRLEWQGPPEQQLQAVVGAAIQMVTVQERAAAAGVDPDDLLALMAPVPLEEAEIGVVAGRGPNDGTAAVVMTALLLMAIFVYGNLVLTGVVEEKASRVVEVLLARVSARTLLVGKVAGIGLLGFAQFVVTALAALVATLAIDSVDIPAISGGVLAWVVVWFVLGYGLYAMAYGALGSLASRTEDAQSVAGPVGYILVAGYWASFITVSGNPASGWSRLLSYFPATAPLAMPGRIVLGATAWWEPVVAVVLTLAAITWLVVFAGRVYARAILRTGPKLRLRDTWRGAPVRVPRTSQTETRDSEPAGQAGTGLAGAGRHGSRPS